MLDFQVIYPHLQKRVGWCHTCGVCVPNVDFDDVGIICENCNTPTVHGRDETMEYFLTEKRTWSCFDATSGHLRATLSK